MSTKSIMKMIKFYVKMIKTAKIQEDKQKEYYYFGMAIGVIQTLERINNITLSTGKRLSKIVENA